MLPATLDTLSLDHFAFENKHMLGSETSQPQLIWSFWNVILILAMVFWQL